MNLRNSALVSILSLFLLAGCWDTGSGEKLGTITRLQRTGLFCKTWEGEIIRGGLNAGSGVVGAAFHFTIEDDALAEQVKKAMEAQQEVKITYRTEANSLCRSDSNSTFLSKIEAIGTVTTPPKQSSEVPGISPPKATQATDPVTTEILKQNQQMLANQQAMLANQQAVLEEMRKTTSKK